MLIAVDQDRALDYLATCIDQVQTFNDILQLVIVELVHKVNMTVACLVCMDIRCRTRAVCTDRAVSASAKSFVLVRVVYN